MKGWRSTFCDVLQIILPKINSTLIFYLQAKVYAVNSSQTEIAQLTIRFCWKIFTIKPEKIWLWSIFTSKIFKNKNVTLRKDINLFWCTVNNSNNKFNSHFLSPRQSLCRQFLLNRYSSSDHKILLKNLYNYARENLALVNIYIKEPVVTRILRDQRIPVIWFVANCGGILGLCMGEWW